MLDPITMSAIISGGSKLLGGILGGIGEGKENDKKAALTREQLQLQREQQGLQRAQAVPTRQDWRQNQALLAAILPGLSNASVTAPQGMQQYVPQMSGGFQLPQGGLGAGVMDFFSPEARLGAEREIDMAGMQAPNYDPKAKKGQPMYTGSPNNMQYGSVGYGNTPIPPNRTAIPTGPTNPFPTPVAGRGAMNRNAALQQALGPAPPFQNSSSFVAPQGGRRNPYAMY